MFVCTFIDIKHVYKCTFTDFPFLGMTDPLVKGTVKKISEPYIRFGGSLTATDFGVTFYLQQAHDIDLIFDIDFLLNNG